VRPPEISAIFVVHAICDGEGRPMTLVALLPVGLALGIFVETCRLDLRARRRTRIELAGCRQSVP
jgi:hypothetical protein